MKIVKPILIATAISLSSPLLHIAVRDVTSFSYGEAFAYREGDPRLNRWLGVNTRLVRWCGLYLGKIVKNPPKGYASVKAWRKWGKRTKCRPGTVAVFHHSHVGLVTGVRKRLIRVKSGNDGNAIKDRWRRASTIRECRVY